MNKIRVHLYAALIPVYYPGIDRVAEGDFKQFESSKEEWVARWFADAHKVVRYAIVNNFANGVQWCYPTCFKSETEAEKCWQNVQDYCKLNNLKVEISDLKNDLRFCEHPQIQFVRYFDILGVDLDESKFKKIFLKSSHLSERELLENFICEIK